MLRDRRLHLIQKLFDFAGIGGTPGFLGAAEGSFWLSAFVATIQAKKGISQPTRNVFAKYMI
jgi:hypothetical protein